jgi:hypothetical protein
MPSQTCRESELNLGAMERKTHIFAMLDETEDKQY